MERKNYIPRYLNSLIVIFLPSGPVTSVMFLGMAWKAVLTKSSPANRASAAWVVIALIMTGYAAASATDALVFSILFLISLRLSAVERASSLRNWSGLAAALSGRSRKLESMSKNWDLRGRFYGLGKNLLSVGGRRWKESKKLSIWEKNKIK